MSRQQIDIMIIIEMNLKQTIVIESIIKTKLKKIGRGMEIIYADSKAYKTTEGDWLQGGVMNIFKGHIADLIQKEKVKKDEKGRWIAYLIRKNEKIVVIVIIY